MSEPKSAVPQSLVILSRSLLKSTHFPATLALTVRLDESLERFVPMEKSGLARHSLAMHAHRLAGADFLSITSLGRTQAALADGDPTLVDLHARFCFLRRSHQDVDLKYRASNAGDRALGRDFELGVRSAQCPRHIAPHRSQQEPRRKLAGSSLRQSGSGCRKTESECSDPSGSASRFLTSPRSHRGARSGCRPSGPRGCLPRELGSLRHPSR